MASQERCDGRVGCGVFDRLKKVEGLVDPAEAVAYGAADGIRQVFTSLIVRLVADERHQNGFGFLEPALAEQGSTQLELANEPVTWMDRGSSQAFGQSVVGKHIHGVVPLQRAARGRTAHPPPPATRQV